MCEKAIEENPWCFKSAPGHFKTEKMCIKAVEKKAETLEHVPDQFKTEKMCEMIHTT